MIPARGPQTKDIQGNKACWGNVLSCLEIWPNNSFLRGVEISRPMSWPNTGGWYRTSRFYKGAVPFASRHAMAWHAMAWDTNDKSELPPGTIQCEGMHGAMHVLFLSATPKWWISDVPLITWNARWLQHKQEDPCVHKLCMQWSPYHILRAQKQNKSFFWQERSPLQGQCYGQAPSYIYIYMYMNTYGHIWTHMHTYGYIWIHMGAQEPGPGPKLAAQPPVLDQGLALGYIYIYIYISILGGQKGTKRCVEIPRTCVHKLCMQWSLGSKWAQLSKRCKTHDLRSG